MWSVFVKVRNAKDGWMDGQMGTDGNGCVRRAVERGLFYVLIDYYN